jgi:hypothetical protein
MKRFLRLRTIEGIDLLMIDSEIHEKVLNNTNYEYTYYILSDIRMGEPLVLGEREESVTSNSYNTIIADRPILFVNGEASLTIGMIESATIQEFLGMEETPLINIGDVNPYEHGFFLVDINSEFDYYVTRINKCPDTGKYIAFDYDVPKEEASDYNSLLDIELDNYLSNTPYEIKEYDIPLFFNIL